jgi:hypothetical protein
MIYCITNQRSYTSSLNIFAVIGGIFLMKGSLRAARIISLFAAFLISVFIGVLVMIPVLFPLGLVATYVKLRTGVVIAAVIVMTGFIVLVVWTYRCLTGACVREAMSERGIDYKGFWRRPSRGFWTGGCLAAFAIVLVFVLLHGEAADEAKVRAAAIVGPGYRFHVRSISVSSGGAGKHFDASVTAYNDSEIKHVEVEWVE